MITIDKKYSNLLDGYNRAIELDYKLRPELLSHEKERYQSALDQYEKDKKAYLITKEAWNKQEIANKAEWELREKLRDVEWRTTETNREAKIMLGNFQLEETNKIAKINNKKTKKTYLIIAGSSLGVWWILLFLFKIILKDTGIINTPLLNFLLSIFFFVGASTLLMAFTSKANITPINPYVYQSRPESVRPATPNEPMMPIEPTKEEFFLTPEQIDLAVNNNGVVINWLGRIQYRPNGYSYPKIYFDQLLQENPTAEIGIPGEVNLWLSLNGGYWGYDWNHDDFGRMIDSPIEDSDLCLLGLLTPNGDIDNVYINPSGIWLLESKYKSGKMTFEGGQFHQYYSYHYRGGRGATAWEEKEDAHAKNYVNQYNGHDTNAKNYLKKYLKKGSWIIGLVHGGIVWTHSDIVDYIDQSKCPIPCGDIYHWKSVIKSESRVSSFTLQKRLEVADALLAGSRNINQKETVSAVPVVDEIYNQLIERLCDTKFLEIVL